VIRTEAAGDVTAPGSRIERLNMITQSRWSRPDARERNHFGERNHLEAAILLVAGGRYPEVVVTNLDDPVGLVRELGPSARQRGVHLAVSPAPDGAAHAIVVSPR
jgi:hypothetical protein